MKNSQTKNRTETIAVSELVTNNVQPPGRTKKGIALKRLRDSIVEHGVLSPPLVAKIRGKYVLIDGHRRVAAWVSLGNTSITCTVLDACSVKEAEQLFAEIDGATKKLKGVDRFWGWAHASDRDAYLSVLPVNVAANIREIIKIFGPVEAAHLAENGIEPAVVAQIRIASRFLCQYCDNPPSIKEIGHWVFKHHASVVIRVLAMKGHRPDAERLLRHIQKDKKLILRRRGDR